MQISNRYSYTETKEGPQEIVLLQGTGCFWKKCLFCDYYLDSNVPNKAHELNQQVLGLVTGKADNLLVINSGSYFELPKATRDLIESILIQKNIKKMTIEAHYLYKDKVKALKKHFKALGIELSVRIGIETFDEDFRENVLKKGMGNINVSELSDIFDQCCLIYGIKDQSEERLISDLKTALENFEAVYLNIYEDRGGLPADPELINHFLEHIYPKIKDEPKLNILVNVTDLGVG